MSPALRVAISTIRFSRTLVTSTAIRDISRIPIKLPPRLPPPYEFLEQFRITLLLDTEKTAFYEDERGSSRKPKMPKAGFYAVRIGRRPGIYDSWAECEAQTKGHTGAVFKKFPTRSAAQEFIGGGGATSKPYSAQSKPIASGLAKKSSSGRASSHLASTSVSLLNTPSTTESSATKTTSSDLDQSRERARSQGFTVTGGDSGSLVVYTDGSSLGNGQKGATAGSGVWWGNTGQARTLNLAERLPGHLQTNNRGELLAIIRALESCPFPELPLEIRTDSQYSISCITRYLPGWIRNNFRSSTGQPVKNKDMIVHLLALLNQRGNSNGVRFVHVRAHRGEAGNEGADILANTGAAMQTVPDRTDWFTLKDANQFTNNRQKLTQQPSQGALTKPTAESGEPDAQEQGSAFAVDTIEDIVPVEIEVDPTWLLTEEEMIALDAD